MFSSADLQTWLTGPRIKQYKTQISRWKLKKYVPTKAMKAIQRKQYVRAAFEGDKNPLRFRLNGAPVDPKKIDRWERNNIREDEHAISSPVPCKICQTRTRT